MRILQLCKKFPYPLRDGESIAVIGLSQSLHQQGCEISLLAMNTSKHFYKMDKRPGHLDHFRRIETVEVDNRVRLLPAFHNLFSSDSYHICRFESNAFRAALIRMLEEESFDVIQLETPYLSLYLPEIRKYSKAKVVMRAHNVEHEIWERMAAQPGMSLKKRYLGIQARRLRQFEVEQLNRYDFLMTITERDERLFRKLGYEGESLVVPAGIELTDDLYRETSIGKDAGVSFIGSLDWMPNQEGLDWFLKEIWPQVHNRFPEIPFYVAGRNMPEQLKKRVVSGVHFLGEVPSSRAFIKKHPIMVVPLHSGSGMRIKILEGMAMGRLVVTTPLGLEGIDAEHGKEVLVARNAKEFFDCLNWAITQPEEMRQISRQARTFVERAFDRRKIGEMVYKALQDQVFENV